jgi:hypothetical protein
MPNGNAESSFASASPPQSTAGVFGHWTRTRGVPMWYWVLCQRREFRTLPVGVLIESPDGASRAVTAQKL